MKAPDGAFAVIEGVGDGHCLMRLVSNKQTQRVSYADFKEGWKLGMDRNELKDKGAVLDCADTLAGSNENFELQRAWARVQTGLVNAQFWVDKRHKMPAMEIFTKPNKRVYVAEPVKAYDLFLLPHSTSYAIETSKSKKPLEIHQDWVNSNMQLSGKPLYIKPQWQPVTSTVLAGAACTEPFWAVRKVMRADAGNEAGNVELVDLTTQGALITQYAAHDSIGMHESIMTPCLTNNKDLVAGDELVWLGDFHQKKRTLKPVMQVEKKQKLNETDMAEF